MMPTSNCWPRLFDAISMLSKSMKTAMFETFLMTKRILRAAIVEALTVSGRQMGAGQGSQRSSWTASG
jgi:hypothetical protein